MEVAKGDFDKKIITDMGKLTRESNDNTDELHITLVHDGVSDDKFT